MSCDSEESEINFDRARSTTVNSLLRAFESNLQYFKRRRGYFFADKLLVYYEWKARYEVEEQANEKQ